METGKTDAGSHSSCESSYSSEPNSNPWASSCGSNCDLFSGPGVDVFSAFTPRGISSSSSSFVDYSFSIVPLFNSSECAASCLTPKENVINIKVDTIKLDDLEEEEEERRREEGEREGLGGDNKEDKFEVKNNIYPTSDVFSSIDKTKNISCESNKMKKQQEFIIIFFFFNMKIIY
jgi:hypothetical protein